MDKSRYYLAYGSNMNLEQMKKRCPTAELVGRCWLYGYRLRFRGPNLGAVATIEEDDSAKTPVLLWKLQPEDEQALDLYEGFPHLYRKQLVEATVDWLSVAAMVYIMNEELYPYALPGLSYYETIEQGYMQNNIDISLLEEAVNNNFKEAF